MEKEPEWYNMQPFLEKYTFGQFAVLMVACGLNDFQLKGTADISYWPKIKTLLESRAIVTVDDIGGVLHEFYSNERLGRMKNTRLNTFMKSSMARDMANSTPESISKQFIEYWQRLAHTMNQTSEKKTIVFAMKCLGLALLMAGECSFDFDPIPIPVDLRVRRLTAQLGFSTSTDEDVRLLWRQVLSALREENQCVTMVHLDSFVWQIAGVETSSISDYFKKVGCPEVGSEFTKLLSE